MRIEIVGVFVESAHVRVNGQSGQASFASVKEFDTFKKENKKRLIKLVEKLTLIRSSPIACHHAFW